MELLCGVRKADVTLWALVLIAIVFCLEAAAETGCDTFNATEEIEWLPQLETYPEDTNVTFSCRTSGHVLRGEATLICRSNFTWSGELPSCYQPVCYPNYFSNVVNVEPQYDSYVADEEVTFTCVNSSRQPIGNKTAKCQANGSWTNQPPLCLVTCGSPPTLPEAFGAVSYTGCEHVGCERYYKCYEKNDTIRCQDNGIWSDFQGPCAEIRCLQPSLISNTTYTTDNGPNGNWYPLHTNATYICSAKLRLHGDPQVTCQENGNWSAINFTCIEDNNTVQDGDVVYPATENPSTQTVVTCRTPPHHSPNLRVIHDGTFLHYSCDSGYELLNGDEQRQCLPNGTWSGAAPRCAAPASVVPAVSSAPSDFRWEQVFIAYSNWVGHYSFRNEDIEFRFEVQFVQLDGEEGMTGLLTEEDIQFEVQGVQAESGIITLSIKRIMTTPTERFPSTEWSVQGHLEENECTWSYLGQVHSDVEGFDTFTMFTTRDDVSSNSHCSRTPNMSMVIVSISLACLLVIALGIIAIICIRRTGGMRSSGHRTLTSFENPVYEYEHSLSLK